MAGRVVTDALAAGGRPLADRPLAGAAYLDARSATVGGGHDGMGQFLWW